MYRFNQIQDLLMLQVQAGKALTKYELPKMKTDA